MQGKQVVVLGGSSGIGLAVAQGALARGAAVTIVARNAEGLARAVAGTPGLVGHQADITDDAAVAAIVEALPAIDHVYAAAGAFVGGTLAGGDMATFRAAFEARIWGTANFIRAAAGRISKSGSITLTGGVSTDRPVAGAWATSVATAAAEQMARALALELAPVRVNAIAPGWTDTPMWDAVLGTAKHDAFAERGASLPTGRIARADEAAAAVLFLMGNAAITGEVIHIDGGHRIA